LFPFVLLLFFSFSSVAFAQEKKIEIKLIEVKGNQKIDRMTLFSKLTIEEGDFFSPKQIRDNISLLYKTGFFDQIEVESEGLEGGVALTFIVHEKPFLVEVVFDGNENITDEGLNEKVFIKTGTFLDKKSIQGYVDKILSAYEDEAYYNTSVVPVLQHLPENRVVLTFLIEEGEQAFIKEIQIEGNESFDDDEILDKMETSTYFWLTSWLSESGRYKKEQLAFDREHIRDFYMDNGYIRVEIQEPELKLSKDKKWFTLRIPVVEGPQFKIGEIAYEGNQLFDTQEMVKLTRIKSGEIFNRSLLRQDIARMTDHYGEKGYIYANIVPDLAPSEADLRVDVFFRVVEGEPVKVREIHISGNNKTRDKVIRREVRVNEQEKINTKALRRSFQRLNNLNYFETINIAPRPVAPQWVDLDVEVKEKPTGTFSIGGGYSSVDKFVATIDVTLGNFLGKGQLVKLRAEAGGRRNTYSLTFREPYLFDREISGTVNLFNQVRRFGVYSEKRTGGNLSLGKAFGEFVRGSVSYTAERLEVFDLDRLSDGSIDPSVPNQVVVQEALGRTSTSAIGFSLSRDTRDFIFDPKKGSRHSISLEYAGTFLGGDNAYYKIIEDSSRFFPLWWDHVFSVHGRLGFAKGINGKTLPVGERFFVGGINTVRGFNFGRAGPIDKGVGGRRGEVLGGNKELFFNLEYLIPLVKAAQVKWLFFYDYGAAFDDGESIKTSGMRRSAGFGIRWISPVGPLRLEWGFNLDKKPGEPDKRVEFSIGSLF